MRRYSDNHLTVDFGAQTVLLNSEQLVFTRKEFELLAVLVRNAGEVLRRDDLMQCVWGYSKEARTRTLDVHIRHLRRKLGGYGDQYIETIFGVGYRFQPLRPRPLDHLMLLPATA
jgi:two-component system, OmpR family, alkaline phosphatase synthesis response regulator PhoP